MTTHTAQRFPIKARVRIEASDEDVPEFQGEFGVVTTICQTYDGKYNYAVCLDSTGICSVFSEEELAPAEYALATTTSAQFTTY